MNEWVDGWMLTIGTPKDGCAPHNSKGKQDTIRDGNQAPKVVQRGSWLPDDKHSMT